MTLNSRSLVTILVFYSIGLAKITHGESTFYSFESSSTIDNGSKVVTKIDETKLDSSKPLSPRSSSTILIAPSISRALDGIDRRSYRKQVFTNEIGSGSMGDEAFEKFIMNRHILHPSKGYRRRGFVSTARTVESPAYSVDSGGQSSTSLASEIAKLLNVKQGFYSDLYNKIDGPNGPHTTRKPADVIEDIARNNIQHLFSDNNRNRHVSSGHRSFNSI